MTWLQVDALKRALSLLCVLLVWFLIILEEWQEMKGFAGLWDRNVKCVIVMGPQANSVGLGIFHKYIIGQWWSVVQAYRPNVSIDIFLLKLASWGKGPIPILTVSSHTIYFSFIMVSQVLISQSPAAAFRKFALRPSRPDPHQKLRAGSFLWTLMIVFLHPPRLSLLSCHLSTCPSSP